MVKTEIYNKVVQLTAELAQTHVAEKIFKAVAERDSVKAQKIIDTFPEFYPELYQKIVDFGKEFNKLIGRSEEDEEEFKKILERCEVIMYDLAETKVIDKIAKASETEDPTKIKEVIDTFKNEHSYFVNKLMDFQKEYTNFRDTHITGTEGCIFDEENDVDNGIFVFDTNVIDALSFYVLNIFGNIDDVYYFCGYDGVSDAYLDAIAAATNEAFAEFVANYNLFEWIGEGEEYKTVGELLVVAMADEFEESDCDEETEE